MQPFKRNNLWTTLSFLLLHPGTTQAFTSYFTYNQHQQYHSTSSIPSSSISDVHLLSKKIMILPTNYNHGVKLFSSAPSSVEAPSKKNNGKSFPFDNLVVVNRGRQSMAFRQGSPLVFSGAISHTLSLDSSQKQLELGTLVAVAVAGKGNNSNNDKGNKSKRGGRGGGKNNNSNKSKENVYPHTDMKSSEEDLQNLQIIGYGIYNPYSMYRVRILCHETSHPSTFKSIKHILSEDDNENKNQQVMKMILNTKIEEALQSRLSLNLPNDNTDSYRLVNGEGDGLSGLAIDVLGGNVAVIMSSAAWCEIYKDEIKSTFMDVLASQPNMPSDMELVWRTTESRLKQDGYSNEDEEEDEDNLFDPDRSVIATESNIQYKVYPWANGQKTGFYCDQRDNRLQVAELCKNKRVLDLCCYNGGFSLNVMKHGASSCIGVDSSQDAVDAANENAKLNGLDHETCTFVRDDISNFMKETFDRNDGTYFDVIILDPPKLAPSVSGLERASRKYQALNRDAMKLIDPIKGGLLLTCTCSGAMTQKEGGQFFLQTVKEGSLSARRQITLLKTSGAAPCHTQCPASFPAGAYLTAALFHVSPLER